MRSQPAIALVPLLAFVACSGRITPRLSRSSTPVESPDLTLQRVAFARMAEGRVVARGTADRLDYRRASGRLDSTQSDVTLEHPGSGFASFGALHVTAPRVVGDVAGKHGHAEGGVDLQAARGDVAHTERVDYDGPAQTLRADRPVDAKGPGYVVHSRGLTARTDGSAIDLTGGVRGSLDLGDGP